MTEQLFTIQPGAELLISCELYTHKFRLHYLSSLTCCVYRRCVYIKGIMFTLYVLLGADIVGRLFFFYANSGLRKLTANDCQCVELL